MCRCDTGSCGDARLEVLGSITYGAQLRGAEALTEYQAGGEQGFTVAGSPNQEPRETHDGPEGRGCSC